MTTTTGKYVPPSKRPGYIPSSTSLPPARNFPSRERPTTTGIQIHQLSSHFTQPQDSTLTFFSYRLELPEQGPRLPYDPSRSAEATPLPPSPPPPPSIHPLNHLISYIVIFPNSHPAWKAEHQLWTHTNADKMMSDWKGKKRNFGRPIPVFPPFKVGWKEQVNFDGWW